MENMDPSYQIQELDEQDQKRAEVCLNSIELAYLLLL